MIDNIITNTLLPALSREFLVRSLRQGGAEGGARLGGERPVHLFLERHAKRRQRRRRGWPTGAGAARQSRSRYLGGRRAGWAHRPRAICRGVRGWSRGRQRSVTSWRFIAELDADRPRRFSIPHGLPGDGQPSSSEGSVPTRCPPFLQASHVAVMIPDPLCNSTPRKSPSNALARA